MTDKFVANDTSSSAPASSSDRNAASSSGEENATHTPLRHQRLIPVIVAGPLFLQNLDTSIMATSLPAMASSLHVEALHLNLAITSYLLSLAVFLPASGWLADRFGATRVFCAAIALFSLASALCGAAMSVPQLVLFRVMQGIGGAMMVPVGRLILLRSIPATQMVAAMVWFTVPGAVGRVAGPLLGGALVTIASWRWIFLINVPFGIAAIAMTLRVVPNLRGSRTERFDFVGFVLLSIALVTVVAGLETLGRHLVPLRFTLAIGAIALVTIALYARHCKRNDEVIIPPSLLRYRTYRNAVIGGMPLRIALGASPFLLPLLFQLGFGLSPAQSGLLSVSTAVGSLSVRAIMQTSIRRWGFRTPLIVATVVTGSMYLCYGLFRQDTPHLLICAALLVGGVFNSLALVTANTLGFSDIPQRQMGKATALSTMMQQTSISLGVALAASIVSLFAARHGATDPHLNASDFPPAFFVIGSLTFISAFLFSKLPASEGAQFRGK